MRGPCAKQRVYCTITINGRKYEGENDCANPQSVCPREPGEGYEKCKSICQQSGHAEIQALKAAGEFATGSIVVIKGHHYICNDCGIAMKNAGIKSATIVYTIED